MTWIKNYLVKVSFMTTIDTVIITAAITQTNPINLVSLILPVIDYRSNEI
jgi:hypothetical protein